MATYTDGSSVRDQTASFVTGNPVQAARSDANRAPEFASTDVNRRIAENSAGTIVGGPVTATDADGDILTYSLSGADVTQTIGGAEVDRFTINPATGQLMVGDSAVVNFEVEADQEYMVTVIATDSSGVATGVPDNPSAIVTIDVTNLNEKPTFTEGPAGFAVDAHFENAALDIDTYTATDPEMGSVTLSLRGADAGLFELKDPTPPVAGSKVLAFKAMPDFELPGDRNRDNVYEVTVRASDGEMHADRMVDVKVIGVEEAGEVTLSSQEAVIGVELTATLSDSDGGVPDPARFADQKWTWHRLATAEIVPMITIGEAPGNEIKDATSSTYTPTSADSTSFLAAMVSYTDRTRDDENGFANTATLVLLRAVQPNAANRAPKFREGASTFRVVMEDAKPNSTATGAESEELIQGDVGNPVSVTDDNGDTLSFTLGGPGAAHFKVSVTTDDDDTNDVNESGQPQIEVKAGAMLDYETNTSHTVTLTANDGSGTSTATAMITVIIYVTDVDEKPTIMVGSLSEDLSISGAASPSYAENGRGVVATYTVTGTNAASATWSLEGDDAGDFTISGGMLRFVSSPDFEMPADDNGDNTYMVTVKASDGTDMDTYEVTVTVTDEDEEGQADDLLETYDTNDNNRIDKSEALTAIEDYIFGGILTKEQALEVITLYIFGSS